MNKIDLKEYLLKNLKIDVDETFKGRCQHIIIELSIEDEIISRAEIEIKGE